MKKLKDMIFSTSHEKLMVLLDEQIKRDLEVHKRRMQTVECKICKNPTPIDKGPCCADCDEMFYLGTRFGDLRIASLERLRDNQAKKEIE